MTNPTPHGQVLEALIDLIDAYAETHHHRGGIYNAKTEAARKAVIEALSGVQALSAAPAEGMTIAGDGASALGRLMREQRQSRLGVYPDGNPNAALAASPTPPAEQQADPGAVYAELPAPTASIGTDDAWHEAAMRDFADRTHAARLRCKSEQARLATLWGYVRADAAPKAAPVTSSTQP